MTSSVIRDGIYGLLGMTLMGAFGLSEPAIAAAALPILCTVSGEQLIKPRMASVEICKQFLTGAEKALGIPVTQMDAQALSRSSRWIKIDVRFQKPGIASAIVTHRTGGKTKSHPEISIAVSDRPLDIKIIKLLVNEVNKLIEK